MKRYSTAAYYFDRATKSNTLALRKRAQSLWGRVYCCLPAEQGAVLVIASSDILLPRQPQVVLSSTEIGRLIRAMYRQTIYQK